MSESASGAGRRGCLLLGCAAAVAMGALLCVLPATIPLGFRGWAAAREASVASEVAPKKGRFVRSEDVAMYVQEHGPKSGPVVVLIPGTSSWSGTWRDTQAELADRGFRVVSLDLPPFGFSQRPANERYDRPMQASRILGVLDALEIERAAFVGHSFGGGPTLEATMLAPERVWALVLVDGAIALDSAGADPGAAGVAADTPWLREIAVSMTFQNPLVTRSVLQSMIHDPADATDDRVALYQQPFPVEGTTPAIGAWLPEIVSPTSAWSLQPKRIEKLKVPTLLIWGAEDTITPPSQAEHLAELLPNARIAWMDGVGHIPQIEDVDGFHDALVPFLRKHR